MVSLGIGGSLFKGRYGVFHNRSNVIGKLRLIEMEHRRSQTTGQAKRGIIRRRLTFDDDLVSRNGMDNGRCIFRMLDLLSIFINIVIELHIFWQQFQLISNTAKICFRIFPVFVDKDKGGVCGTKGIHPCLHGKGRLGLTFLSGKTKPTIQAFPDTPGLGNISSVCPIGNCGTTLIGDSSNLSEIVPRVSLTFQHNPIDLIFG